VSGGEGLSKEEVELCMALVAFANPFNYEKCEELEVEISNGF